MDLLLAGMIVRGSENHSLATLRRAAEDAGFAAAVAPFGGFPEVGPILALARARSPKIVGVSIQSTELALPSVTLLQLLRAQGFRGMLVVGGHFATLHAEDLLRAAPAIDAVVRLAGEQALVGLLRAASGEDVALRDLPGVVLRGSDGGVVLGAPAVVTPPGIVGVPHSGGLREHLGIPAADVLLSRGCEHRCDYCCVASVSAFARSESKRAGRRPPPPEERRDVDAIADELARLHALHGARAFQVMDDNLLPHGPAGTRDWALGLRHALDRRGVGSVALALQLRADAIDEESARALAHLGLARAYVGIDGYSREAILGLGRRIDPDAGTRALALLRKEGVLCLANALLLGPTQRFDVLSAELEALRRVEHAAVHLLPIDARAGTPYHREALRRGLLEGSFLLPRYRFEDERVGRVARVLLAMPTRLAERSVPIALYDLAYNLGVARRLLPGLELRLFDENFDAVTRAWNLDQTRLLAAALVAARSGEMAVDACIAEEGPSVARHDRELLRRTDDALIGLERAVARHLRRPVEADRRGVAIASIAAVALSISACTTSHVPGDASSDAIVDAPNDSPADSIGDLPPSLPWLDDGCAGASVCEGFLLQFDASGCVVGVLRPDGGVVSPTLATCLLEPLHGNCYPSYAGQTVPWGTHCWIA